MPKSLTVDDNDDNRDVLARRLQRRGFDVTQASGGKLAVAQATSDNLLSTIELLLSETSP